ncbi:A24 family peptidase [Alterisphingorhabdus coralli]|uniref:Prepilin peptidase n=1 Tax=Alterisphingorhabdus coralli TaxID=3071408 RepID=A0AA97HZG1_9SPHN|nr:prepilin peptidase [Parasphingorhabdus sp. SCSIO 66989]WOE74614.1 prepilin peptidase [Parasphingorhabdus sp. SCSIO 66989]
MTGVQIIYGMLGALAIALAHASYTDIRRREIENWLNAGIALAAPVFWWATGMSLWPDIAIQIALALGVFTIFTGLFALGAMGGGDVKLLSALALWFSWQDMLMLVLVMSIAGGILTLFMAMVHTIRRSKGNLEIPYGVAIAFAGLWVIAEHYFNHSVQI